MTDTAPLRRQRALLLLTAVLFGSWTVWTTIVLPRLPPSAGLEQTLRAVSVRMLLWVLPAALYLWALHRERALSPLRLGLPPTAQDWGFAATIVVAAGGAVSLDVARKLGIAPAEVWSLLIRNFELTFPVAPLFEELIFRGVLLAELLAVLGVDDRVDAADTARRLRVWLANLTASWIFTGLHWPWWIYTEGFGAEFWMKTAGVFLISLVLGMLFVRGKSLWPCILLHWLNNELSALATG